MTSAARFYVGSVVHQRLRPVPHRLIYRVFSLLVDVDRIDDVARHTRFFSRNRFNLVSLHDCDHGAGDGQPIGVAARAALAAAGLTEAGHRIDLLAYPRVLGYVFNPLSVYFCHDAAGRLAALIYEVNNTVGERTSYVVAAGYAENPAVPVLAQSCAKAMYVSPFTPADGRYQFRIRPPGDDVLVGVALRDSAGPLLRTHFRGVARSVDGPSVLRLFVGHPLLTAKIVAAIHWEALKLFAKGVPVVRRHVSPRYSVRFERKAEEGLGSV
jgi:hypothetical protein